MNTTIAYYSFHVLGFLALMAYVLLSAKRFGFTKPKALALCAASYIAMYGWMLILKVLVTGTGGQNAIRAYVFFPLFVLLFASALGMNLRKSLSMMAVAPCLVQGISHIGCIFPGCCCSWLEVSWGIYNPVVGTRLFPVQLAEAATALAIAAWLLWRQRQPGYVADGLDMPRMMILFGLTRFCWEFLRDNDKLFLGISELALWALAMAAVGALWLVAARMKAQNGSSSKGSEDECEDE